MKSHKKGRLVLPTIADTLQAGLDHHRAGRLTQASACYGAILAADPRHADVLNLTGVIARQQGNPAASEQLIQRAIALNAGVANYHHHLARAFELQQRNDDAVTHYRQAVALDPSDAESHRLLGNLLLSLGQMEGAIPLFKRVIELNPQCADVYYRLGAMHKSVGDYPAALEFYRQAVAVFPDSTDSNFNLALALFAADQLAEAIPVLQQTVLLNPEDHEAHNLLGQVFHRLMDYPAARAAYLKAVNLKPDDAPALSNFGALYLDMGDFRIAEILLRRAVEMDTTFLEAQCNLGTLFSRKGLALEAIQSFRRVLSVNPSNVSALCSLGCVLFNLGDEDAAEACYRIALEAEPGSVVAHFNTSSSLLTVGRLAEGWEAYEMRWQVRQFAPDREVFEQPQWNGEDLTGRRIYIHAEQGFGDTLQFVRYAVLLAERGVDVILAVQPALLQLLRDIHPLIQVIGKGQEAAPAFDFFCPLMSLPRVFKTDLCNIPARVPYLRPRPEDVSTWAGHIDSANLRVGIVWAGNPLHARDGIRSVQPSRFSQVTETAGITFYSLQKGPAVAQLHELSSVDSIVNVDPDLHDFKDTAAAIAQLDLVITVDTAVAHLAGALGRPVWILLSQASDWRWLRDRADSPWYPSARLFRQSVLGEWDEVLAQVRQALEAMVADREFCAQPMAGMSSGAFAQPSDSALQAGAAS